MNKKTAIVSVLLILVVWLAASCSAEESSSASVPETAGSSDTTSDKSTSETFTTEGGSPDTVGAAAPDVSKKPLDTSVPEAPSVSKKITNDTSVQKATSTTMEPPGTPLLETPDEELPTSDYLPEIPRVSVRGVKAKMDSSSNIVIVDSRSESRYNQSHIAGAISMPLKTMVAPYANLDS